MRCKLLSARRGVASTHRMITGPSMSLARGVVARMLGAQVLRVVCVGGDVAAAAVPLSRLGTDGPLI